MDSCVANLWGSGIRLAKVSTAEKVFLKVPGGYNAGWQFLCSGGDYKIGSQLLLLSPLVTVGITA